MIAPPALQTFLPVEYLPMLPKHHTTAYSNATSETFSITYTSFPASPTGYKLGMTHNNIQQRHLSNIQQRHLSNIQQNLHLLPHP